MEPVEVGNLVADGILANATYLVTHGFFKEAMRARGEAVLAATPDRIETFDSFSNYREE